MRRLFDGLRCCARRIRQLPCCRLVAERAFSEREKRSTHERVEASQAGSLGTEPHLINPRKATQPAAYENHAAWLQGRRSAGPTRMYRRQVSSLAAPFHSSSSPRFELQQPSESTLSEMRPHVGSAIRCR